MDYVFYKLDEITSFCERANIKYPRNVTKEIVNYLKTSQHIVETMQSTRADILRNTIFVSHKSGRRSFQISKTRLQILIDFSQQHVARMLSVSARTINRRLTKHDIKPKTYSNITEIELDAIVRTYIEMLPNGSIRRIKELLRSHNLILLWNSVHISMWRVNPPGLLMCSLRLNVMRRRKYTVPGPTALWYIDGNHKLIRWWLVIHGAIDGYPRQIMYLKCSSNNQDFTVLKPLEDLVKEHDKSSRVPGDHGGENVDVA